jgi:hypothetical protein
LLAWQRKGKKSERRRARRSGPTRRAPKRVQSVSLAPKVRTQDRAIFEGMRARVQDRKTRLAGLRGIKALENAPSRVRVVDERVTLRAVDKLVPLGAGLAIDGLGLWCHGALVEVKAEVEYGGREFGV